jgi:hypothetical protein
VPNLRNQIIAELPATAIRHSRKNNPIKGSHMDALRRRRFDAVRRAEAPLVFLAGLTSL